MHKKRIFILALFFLSLSAAVSQASKKDSCLECHRTLDGKAKEPTDHIALDVHFKRGLSCSDCHGGDPAKEDFSQAKDPATGFVGKPTRSEIPNFCGKCHADAAYMRKFNPNISTDQLAQYNKSKHGQLNAQGDTKIAVCTSCHDVHGIKETKDPSSPAFITNVPKRCASCHADKEYMKDYHIPTDQMEKFGQSVHGEALLVKGDRGAPACSSCHGSHDADLPQASSVGNVCAQCHSLTRDLFAQSPHKAAHDKLGIPECEACHGNHKILRPSDNMLGTGEGAVCLKCHQSDSKGYVIAAAMKNSIESLKTSVNEAGDIISHAGNLGMETTDAQFGLDAARNSLTKARTYVHTFSKDKVGDITKEGIGLAEKAKKEGQKSVDEFAFRRKGFAAAIMIILLLAGALYFKIRMIEKG